MLSNTLMLNVYYLEIIHIFHPCHIFYPCYHPEIIGHTLKNKQNNKGVCSFEIIWLIIVKMKMKIKNRPHIHDINSPRSRHIVNIRSVSVWGCLYISSNTYAAFEAQFMRKLSNIEVEFKKDVAYKKSKYYQSQLF